MHPGVLIGVVIVLAVAAAATFGLFVQRHAQLAELNEERTGMEIEKVALGIRNGQLDNMLAQVTPEGATAAVPKTQALAVRLQAKTRRLQAEMDQLRQDIERQQAEFVSASAANGSLRDDGHRQHEKLMAEVKERREELAKEEERFFTLQKELDAKRRDLEDKVRQASREVEQVRKAGRDRLAVLDARIAELDERLRQIKSQLQRSNQAMDPDGAIMSSAADHGYVVIDRGLRHNLRTGVRFTVFTKRGGKNVEKGVIEVVRVDETIATARVVSEARTNDPLIAGDLLHNPVYDPHKRMAFLVVGAFKRFNKAELERFITDAGGLVGRELGVDVDFLVAGAETQAQVDHAVRLGISVLSEEQLLEYMRPSADANR